MMFNPGPTSTAYRGSEYKTVQHIWKIRQEQKKDPEIGLLCNPLVYRHSTVVNFPGDMRFWICTPVCEPSGPW